MIEEQWCVKGDDIYIFIILHVYMHIVFVVHDIRISFCVFFVLQKEICVCASILNCLLMDVIFNFICNLTNNAFKMQLPGEVFFIFEYFFVQIKTQFLFKKYFFNIVKNDINYAYIFLHYII